MELTQDSVDYRPGAAALTDDLLDLDLDLETVRQTPAGK
jgi:hypothetical protein